VFQHVRRLNADSSLFICKLAVVNCSRTPVQEVKKYSRATEVFYKVTVFRPFLFATASRQALGLSHFPAPFPTRIRLIPLRQTGRKMKLYIDLHSYLIKNADGFLSIPQSTFVACNLSRGLSVHLRYGHKFIKPWFVSWQIRRFVCYHVRIGYRLSLLCELHLELSTPG
jgi:hypothetical protein